MSLTMREEEKGKEFGSADTERKNECAWPGEIKDSVTKESKQDEVGDIHSEDPFKIYDILDKKQQLNHKISIQSEGDPKFPPGFTPHNSDGLCNQNHVSLAQDHDSKNVIKEDGCSSVNACSFKQVNTPKTGGSMLQLIEDLIKETKMENVNLFDIRSCWGNLSFDFVVGPSVGNSCGILCVWDSNIFHKENFTVSDYFIAIMGKWLPNDRN
ncbi:hypothetical protein Tco_0715241 [Tanacetum coccineum]